MTDKADNVVLLDVTAKPAFVFKKRTGFCHHDRFEVDADKRIVTCRKCGVALDPFEVLMTVSHSWAWYAKDRERIRKEVASVAKQLEELKRDEKNARARLKRIKEKG